MFLNISSDPTCPGFVSHAIDVVSILLLVWSKILLQKQFFKLLYETQPAVESKTIVYKSLHGLAPQYLCHLFTINSVGEARTLRNTTDLKIQKNLP